jgi:DNA-binding SARP family transcriptional activator
MTEMLWPELEPDAALRDFKIAYSTLCNVLEPARKRNAPSAYFVRDGSRYGLRGEADIWLDVARFDALITEGDRLFAGDRAAAVDRYRRAVALYQGEYLQAFPYAEWASEERERLLTLYLRTAERLATALAQEQAWPEVIAVCHAILARDDCWEQAYRLLMQAYAAEGNRPQVLRTYRRCVERLQAELGVVPMPATLAVYEAAAAEEGRGEA